MSCLCLSLVIMLQFKFQKRVGSRICQRISAWNLMWDCCVFLCSRYAFTHRGILFRAAGWWKRRINILPREIPVIFSVTSILTTTHTIRHWYRGAFVMDVRRLAIHFPHLSNFIWKFVIIFDIIGRMEPLH